MKSSHLLLVPVLLFGLLFTNLTAQAQQRRISPQAEGAIIGGLGGATAGAIINKRNRAVGGVVGGVVGAGAGYAIGKHIDNKKKARAAEAERAAAEANARAYRGSSRSEAMYTSAGYHGKGHHATGSAAAAMPPAEAVALNAGYLPNPATGPAAAAYPTSEYRRKSW